MAHVNFDDTLYLKQSLSVLCNYI